MKDSCYRIIFYLKCVVWVALSMQQSVCFSQSVPSGNILVLDPSMQGDTVAWKRPRNIPSKGMLQDFKKLFKAIHGNTQSVQFKRSKDLTEIRYDSLADVYYGKSNQQRGLMPGTKLIAWHPSWMTNEYLYYPYHLLSSIAFFAYDLHPETGAYNDADAIQQWKTTPMIDSAKEHGVQVLLTLTSYGRQGNEKFLHDTERESWLRLSDSLLFLLRYRKAAGIDIDFSGMDPSMKDAFSSFVSFLRNSLDDSTVLTLHIPFNARSGIYDLKKLKPLINTFILKGFDPDGKKCDGKPIPSAPLLPSPNSACDCIANTLEEFLSQGLAPRDIIVSLPLYGTHWNVANGVWRFDKYVPYDDIRAVYATNYQQFVEEQSGSTMIRLGEGANHGVIWYEGAGSLDRKFQWIKEKGLGGAGLWGLGHDGNQPELWATVATAFGNKTWQPIRPIGYGNGTPYTLLLAAQKYRKYIAATLFIIVCFFIVGILLSCLDWRVRDAFFHNHSYRAILAGSIISALVFVVYLLDGTDTPSFSGFCYGILAGGTIVYIVTALYLNYRKKLH